MCGGPVVFHHASASNSSSSSFHPQSSSSEPRAASRKSASVGDTSGGTAGTPRPLVCGLVEGIVPTNHADEQLRGAAVFVESDDIAAFLRDIELRKVTPLVGGEAAQHVGSDQDPAKMDLESILKGKT